MQNYVISIGRELGSGGKAIGEIIAKKLNIPIYDRRLIQMAVEYHIVIDPKHFIEAVVHGVLCQPVPRDMHQRARNDLDFKPHVIIAQLLFKAGQAAYKLRLQAFVAGDGDQ